MDYGSALSYLSELTKFGINLGLERIEELLRRLGNPHRYLSIVHIGGTNGKGSTGAILANIMQKAGYRTGLFTSPHLHSYRERFRIDGCEIREEQLAALLTELRFHLDGMAAAGYEHPTEFEVSTALAFLYFRRERVDVLVLEVGLGGAIDSTNVINPLVTVITNVSLAHMAYLGNSIAEITKVKCGIIKPGTPVVTAATGEALELIAVECEKSQSPLIKCYDSSGVSAPDVKAGSRPHTVRDVTWQGLTVEPTGQRFTVSSDFHVYRELWLPLMGEHQLANGTVALAAAEQLNRQGFDLSGDDIREGLSNTSWPGRMELVAKSAPVLLDGAHNHAGAISLRRSLALHFPHNKLILVLGVLADKEQDKIVEELTRQARMVIVTRPEHPRADNWRDLAPMAQRYVDQVYLSEKVSEALKIAFSAAGADDLICVAGSLYLVAKARELLV